jgi:hypothetical protein
MKLKQQKVLMKQMNANMRGFKRNQRKRAKSSKLTRSTVYPGFIRYYFYTKPVFYTYVCNTAITLLRRKGICLEQFGHSSIIATS